MAYLVLRSGGNAQIRESVRTERGPRSLRLVSFRGPLSDAVLEEAERRARRPLDREALIAKARALGLGWRSSANHAARNLARQLGRGRALDPALADLLRERLAEHPGSGSARGLDEAEEWIGSSAEERGAALRGLLRLSDAIARGRRAARGQGESPRRRAPYPAIDSASHQAQEASHA